MTEWGSVAKGGQQQSEKKSWGEAYECPKDRTDSP